MSDSIRVRAFAKINLGLSILGPRADGFHEIRTVFQSVALADNLVVSLGRSSGRIELDCDDPAIPGDESNLVWRAAEAWRHARHSHRRIHLQLAKRIPAGAGLGGGSSDAAATLLALERLTGNHLPPSAGIEIAAALGSDVPFFLFGGRALGCGRGEEIWPLEDLPPRRCLIAFPGFQVSTAEAYHAFDSRLTPRAEGRKILFIGARPHFTPQEWGPAENDFEDAVFARWPELAKLKGQLIRAGAEIASLTGSGSAVSAIFTSARQMARAARLVPAQTFSTRTLGRAEVRRLMFPRQ